MNSNNDVISFMDLLDLDEDLIDSRLETIMVRRTFSNKHLKNALQLMEYKLMINLQEETDCENEAESNFIAKLLSDLNEESIDLICKIVIVVLNLNKKKIISKSEHLLQQILSDIAISNAGNITEKHPKILLNLKVSDSILDAVIKNGDKLSLIFLEAPLENILSDPDEKLTLHFLTNTVPRFFDGVGGYKILDRIWVYMKQMNEKENALKILSCLSEFYLPIANNKGNIKFESTIVYDYNFWNILLVGLQTNDPSIRKISVYLIKRAIDCSKMLKKNIHIESERETFFIWKQKSEKLHKLMWDNFFILIDSLEEKQSNIVLPSLKLFDTLKNMPTCWLKCAFNIALKHDNTQVRSKCIEYRLKFKICSEEEALTLLEAINDIHLYDSFDEKEKLLEKLEETMKTTPDSYIFKAITKVKWCPVPMYNFSKVLASIKDYTISNKELFQTVIDIIKVPCNNIVMRKAIQVNISYFIRNCCTDMQWKDIINIYTSFNSDMFYKDENPFIEKIFKLYLNAEEKEQLFNVITDTHCNIDFALIYLKSHKEDSPHFIDKLREKIKRVQDNTSRQYSDKMECLNDAVYLAQLFRETVENEDSTINAIVTREYKTMLQYIFTLLSNENENLRIEDISLLLKGLYEMASIQTQDEEQKEIELQLYKSSILLLKDNNVEIKKKVLSIFILNNVLRSESFLLNYKHEIIKLQQILNILTNCEFSHIQNKESNGRYRNVFFEKSCEFIYFMIKQHDKTEIKENIKVIIEFIENVTESGGYGCLLWILKIMNKILPELLINENLNVNVIQFIDRMWKEIEELKSNNQYSPCIEEFVNLITHEELLKRAMYNNIIISYCNTIIEYGPLKNAPLFYLIRNLGNKELTTNHGQMIYTLSEILLYSPIPRKDQRITENVELEILHDPMYGMNNTDIHFNYQIKHLSITALSKINNPEILDTILSLITTKIDNAFRNKQRYHGNSQPHRLLLTGLQHLLTIGLLSVDSVFNDGLLNWMVELMGKLPHQPSVRICMEWYIALYLNVKKIKLDSNIELIKSSKVPLTSQFVILYWVLKHKVTNSTYVQEEYDFVMDILLSHTMGQVFNVRLYAQYLAYQIYNIKQSQKYSCAIDIIQKTFKEGAKDKHFIKLKDDVFINKFDIINNLTPCFVYHFMPRYFDIGANEVVHQKYIRNVLKIINDNLSKDIASDMKKEWSINRVKDEDVFSYNFDRNVENGKALDSGDSSGTIQKKYIPWKNMSDMNVYDTDKKRESNSQLIVVASLIDKLPNLGGMARTSEVFGVKTYVVDSLRHLQDKQFQGLSVSAERWVDIEEVRPGQPLKDYLMKKKAAGYSVVAAEQTSTSSKLQTFKFPLKTLLLLGHEKEGIPCDLLPFMDHCVEIPQQGFVRSLNVHVTASIFIWEYVRQNLL